MEVGWRCLLNTSDVVLSSSGGGTTRATGVIVGKQRHVEDANRELYYFHCVSLELPGAYRSAIKRDRATFTLSDQMQKHFANDITSKGFYYASTEGYKYSLDGWYDAEYLTPLTERRDGIADASAIITSPMKGGRRSTAVKPLVTEIPSAWTEAMEQHTSPCEVRYLCYAFHPWFSSPFHALEYLTLPERQCCYSVYICHRCLTPFFSQTHLTVHLEGYCHMTQPCGELLYHNPNNQQKVFYINAAKNLHYGRCASLLGKLFIESKLLNNDVDLYEFFIVTIPACRLPYLRPKGKPSVSACTTSINNNNNSNNNNNNNNNNGTSAAAAVQEEEEEEERAFQLAAAQYDTEKWNSDVVVGYFSRLKHSSQTLSCIVTLPPFQQMRLGVFLLDVAYYLTKVRQTMCGCSQCGSPMQGGRISRPFSPHGQQLLLSYWSHALRRSVAKRLAVEAASKLEKSGALGAEVDGCTSRVTASPESTGDGASTFESVEAIRDAMDIPIHLDDLEFLLVHDRCSFYAMDTHKVFSHNLMLPATSLGSTEKNGDLGGGGGGGGRLREPSSSPALVGTLAFELPALETVRRLSIHAAEDEEVTTKWRFDERYLLRDKSGELVYRRDWYHY